MDGNIKSLDMAENNQDIEMSWTNKELEKAQEMFKGKQYTENEGIDQARAEN